MRTKTKLSGRYAPWGYDPSIRVIYHEDGYEIDLEKCTSSAGVLDWMAQLSGKGWVTDEDLGKLFRLFNSLLSLQSNFCSGGREMSPDIQEILEHYPGRRK